MKLARIGAVGQEKPAVVVGDRYLDVSDLVQDFDAAFFEGLGIEGLKKAIESRLYPENLTPMGSARLGSPIARPHQIICIGLNYADHAAETNTSVPEEPIIFTKSPNTLIGPNDDVRIPRNSVKTDWEIELGVVLGKKARYLDSVEEAEDCIAGYILVNDVSEREFQLERQGQWSKGKSSETFNPAGPFLVTKAEVSNPQNLKMTLRLNGKLMQDSSTAQMVFRPAFLVHYLSQFMVLEAGDLINTGTPPGVGLGQKPPMYLKAGDVMELELQGLGVQRQKVINYND